MFRHYILKDRKPVPAKNFLEWADWMQDRENSIVKQTHLGDVLVSTVFLGLDHSFDGLHPILFETMIFRGKHDLYQERYRTWEGAEHGHEKAVEMVLATEDSIKN